MSSLRYGHYDMVASQAGSVIHSGKFKTTSTK
jgi:hypothetical protein